MPGNVLCTVSYFNDVLEALYFNMAASAHGCSVSTVLPFKNVRSWTNRISARHTTFYLDSNTPLSFVELCMQLLHPHCPRPMSKLCMIPMVMFQPKLKCSRDSPPAVSLSAQETWRAWCETGRNVLVQSQKKSGKRNYGAVFTQVWKGLRVIEWWWTESKKAKDIKRERERGFISNIQIQILNSWYKIWSCSSSHFPFKTAPISHECIETEAGLCSELAINRSAHPRG